MPASAVSLEVISSSANRGEVLVVGSTEGGVHPQLALFLGSEVRPVGDRASCSAETMPDIAAANESYGVAVVGSGPDATIVSVKPGFRVFLFAGSLQFSSVRIPSAHDANQSKSSAYSGATPLVFLEDVPDALARLQVIRFGGVDCFDSPPAVSACNTDPLSSMPGQNADVGDRDDGDSSSSSTSQGQEDTPIPGVIVAGLGLGQLPGLSTPMTLGLGLQQHIIGASHSAVAGGAEAIDPGAAVEKAQRQAFFYSEQLGAAHEAVLAVLSSRPSCFDPAVGSSSRKESGMLPGESFKPGDGDEIERDQNRLVNHLIETMFAYKSTLQSVQQVVHTCGRAAQAGLVKEMRSERRMGHRVSQSVVRTLARMGEMLHAWGLDPALYCPASPAVRALIHGVLRRATCAVRENDGTREQQEEETVERSILGALTESFLTRVSRNCAWIIPVAVMAGARPDEFPSRGWWDTCSVLLANRHRRKHSNPSQLDLPFLFSMAVPSLGMGTGADMSTGGPGIQRATARPHHHIAGVLGDIKEGHEQLVGVEQGLAQVRSVGATWLGDHPGLGFEDSNADLSAAKVSSSESNLSDSDGRDVQMKGRATLSPHCWKLGFDTSNWTQNEATVTAIEFARAQSTSTSSLNAVAMSQQYKESNGEATRCEIADDTKHAEVNPDPFFTRLSELWHRAKEDRSNLSHVQKVAAERFCHDEYLQRLVLLEVTMNDVFERLPGYVLSQPSQWVNWIGAIRDSLRATKEEEDPSDSQTLLYLQLSTPPPAFGSRGSLHSTTEATDDMSSESSSGSMSHPSASSDENDRDSGDDADSIHPHTTPPHSTELDNPIGRETDVPGESPLDPGSGLSRVRRDSRERMKVKLGHLDGVDGDIPCDDSEGSRIDRPDFVDRATILFGVSSQSKEVGIQGLSFPKKASELRERVDVSFSGVAKGAAGPRVDTVEVGGSDGDTEGGAAYITFVAESFRPRRDNSDWHKEIRSEPPPPAPPEPVPEVPAVEQQVAVAPDADLDNDKVDDVAAAAESENNDAIAVSERRKSDHKRRRKGGEAAFVEETGGAGLVAKQRSDKHRSPRLVCDHNHGFQ